MQTKYKFTYIDDFNNTYHVELQKQGYEGEVIELAVADSEPVAYRSVSRGRAENKIIFGGQLTFALVFRRDSSGDDVKVVSELDELFKSEYKDWKLRWLKGEDLLFEGWILIEDLYRDVVDEIISIEIIATDGLGDLRDYEFKDGDNFYDGRVTILEAVKKALEPLDLPFNFEVKLNTEEINQADPGDLSALSYVYVDLARFNRLKDGRREADNCYDVITKLLKPLSVTVRQWRGKYLIHNDLEIDSLKRVYNWSDLSFNTGESYEAKDDSIEVDSKDIMVGHDEISYIPPINTFDVFFRNRNVGTSIVENLDIWEGDESPWQIGAIEEEPNYYQGTAQWWNAVIVEVDENIPNFYFELKNKFDLEKIIEDTHIIFEFKIMAIAGEGATDAEVSEATWAQAYIIGEDDSSAASKWLKRGYNTLIVEHPLKSGDYNVKIDVSFDDLDKEADIYIWDVDIYLAVVDEAGEYRRDLAYDEVHRFVSNKGKQYHETEVHFKDTLVAGDLGSYVLYDDETNMYVPTEDWSREGKTESKSIMQVFAQYFLNLHQDYAKHVQLVYHDSLNIEPNSIVIIDGVYYMIEAFEQLSRRSKTKVRLREILTEDVSFTELITNLDTVDGELSGGVLVAQPVKGHTHDFSDIPIKESDVENWNEAYDNMFKWDGSDDALDAAQGRESLDVLQYGSGSHQIRNNVELDNRYVSKWEQWDSDLIIDGELLNKEGDSRFESSFLNGFNRLLGYDDSGGLQWSLRTYTIENIQFTLSRGGIDVAGKGIFGDDLDVVGKGMFGDDLDVVGKGIFGDDLDVSGKGIFRDDLQHPEFSQGILGQYWLLSEDYNNTGRTYFEIDNMRVRGELSAHIFKKDIVRASSGLLYITDSSELTEGVTTPSSIGDDFTVIVKDAVFNEGDRLEFKDVDDNFNIENVIVDVISDLGGGSYNVELVLGEGIKLSAGDVFVRISGATILNDASTDNAPFLEMREDMNELRLRLGNLNGVYGYNSNVYGLAVGDPDSEHITIEPDNGIRFLGESGDVLAYISGNIFRIGESDSRFEFNASTGRATIEASVFDLNAGDNRLRIETDGHGVRRGSPAISLLNRTFGEEGMQIQANMVDARPVTFEPRFFLGSSDNYIKWESETGILEVVGRIEADSGNIGGWRISEDAIWSTVKHSVGGYANSGITLGAEGSIHTPNFYINSDGNIGIRSQEFIYGYETSNVGLIEPEEENSTSSEVYVTLLDINLGQYVMPDRTLRIGFEYRAVLGLSGDPATTYVQLVRERNGDVEVLETYTTIDDFWRFERDDFEGWRAGDRIRIDGRVSRDSDMTLRVRNLAIYGYHISPGNEMDGTF